MRLCLLTQREKDSSTSAIDERLMENQPLTPPAVRLYVVQQLMNTMQAEKKFFCPKFKVKRVFREMQEFKIVILVCFGF